MLYLLGSHRIRARESPCNRAINQLLGVSQEMGEMVLTEHDGSELVVASLKSWLEAACVRIPARKKVPMKSFIFDRVPTVRVLRFVPRKLSGMNPDQDLRAGEDCIRSI